MSNIKLKMRVERLRTDLRERELQVVGSHPPDSNGLYDMLGNVWEWTYDYFNTQPALVTNTQFPSGPDRGLERVLMGGSFRSGFWGRRNESVSACDFRTGRAEDAKSQYTGFRLCRTIANSNYTSLEGDNIEEWLAQFDRTGVCT